ncbi:hypothetical protein [Kitasatospora sp. MBT63]|uniref:hypothetical protein n=1 Tax=Kitasatospora sp. MBT63 TaxID=1444768 RepID=UPI00053ACE19|nr:hypothetical protein [Kitasatospora sp. MBT63]
MSNQWHSIPIPDLLAARPRTRAGAPIPANTPWRAPGADVPMQLRFTDGLGPHLTCDCVQGEGVPSFGDQCPVAQRRQIQERLCSACGRDLALGGEPPVFVAGVGSPVFVEPAMHAPCAAFALFACPVLSSTIDRLAVTSFTYYAAYERRANSLNEAGQPQHHAFELGDPLARLLGGVLDYYIAIPEDTEPILAADWLEARRAAGLLGGGPRRRPVTAASPATPEHGDPQVAPSRAGSPQPVLAAVAGSGPAGEVGAGRAAADDRVHLTFDASWTSGGGVVSLCEATLERAVDLTAVRDGRTTTCPVCFGRSAKVPPIILPAAAHDAWLQIIRTAPGAPS